MRWQSKDYQSWLILRMSLMEWNQSWQEIRIHWTQHCKTHRPFKIEDQSSCIHVDQSNNQRRCKVYFEGQFMVCTLLMAREELNRGTQMVSNIVHTYKYTLKLMIYIRKIHSNILNSQMTAYYVCLNVVVICANVVKIIFYY